MALKPVSVTQLNEYISRVIGTDPLLMNIGVNGEISGVRLDRNGNAYFALVDEQSSIDCIVWHDNPDVDPDALKDGLEVVIRGYVNVYKKRGTISLTVRSCELIGTGGLAQAFEEMKQKLNAEGLFDQEHKKTLPAFPRKIAVVTASTGAAVQDIIKTTKSRNSVVSLYIYPTPVQGDGAARQIAYNIDLINRTRDDIDIIIVGRGGGSAEDLWPFNEEVVARAIYASRIPVISAVGHEIDYSISDLVADVRAATPTAAAQIAVPDTSDLAQEIEDLRNLMMRELKNNAAFDRIKADNIRESMKSALASRMTGYRNEIESMKVLLESNDPGLIMKRGYSIVRDADGKVIRSSDEVDVGQELEVDLSDGKLGVKAISADRKSGRN
ncbi:MAG: exodeoxyribonuclease VII large subunit [Eubacterium sp.]|nr:exodeoxyribonuclease VII large subunit [Eubacterium sp.]